ncbi:uncharacterized protein si:dkey-111f13.5 [Electrophorus electricus]|uniref:uncharacterized protein si:dkey-111f13.5 n=1 Tax=Electrophorus electricus TaxID=8005 RepID=UPI0015D03E0E|nr:uncharacterized protein si:dkey-111f13.5 [Electrophorus electricus]
MSDTKALERMVSRTTLTTQRIRHTHILALGERLRARVSASTAADARAAPFPNAPATSLPLDRAVRPDCAWKEDVQRAATKETEKALKVQEESRRSLVSVRANPAAAAREALGPQRLCTPASTVPGGPCRPGRGWGLRGRRASAWSSRPNSRLAAPARGNRRRGRHGWPREELKGESELEREQEMRVIKEQMEVHVQECVSVAERRVGEERRSTAQMERETLQDSHAQEISLLQDRLQQLQGTLVQVSRERMWYETEFKKVQASYRQFVDLTDTSLHSDYLLKLRCLGREPGLMENTTQTDVSHIPTIP